MASERVLEDLFLREKPAKILVGLKTAKQTVYATVLSREANCTYSHTIKILNLFRNLGIVTFEKTGRIKKVKLTDNGWGIASHLEALVKKFAQIEEAAGEDKGKKEPKKPKGKKSET